MRWRSTGSWILQDGGQALGDDVDIVDTALNITMNTEVLLYQVLHAAKVHEELLTPMRSGVPPIVQASADHVFAAKVKKSTLFKRQNIVAILHVEDGGQGPHS